MTLRIATRASALALWQAEHIATGLRALDRSETVELIEVTTEGDRRSDVPLHVLGGKGTFVTEVQRAVLDGRADLAVHSAKDLPGRATAGLVIAAFPERADARDALVGRPLGELGEGRRVGSGSQRRRVQLRELVPGVELHELRGNVATRLSRVGELDAIVVALAALERLGLADRVSHVFEPAAMTPQVGQGALAVECRTGDRSLRALVAQLDHGATRVCVEAERAFLGELGGDCSLPAGAHVVSGDDGTLRLRALLADDSGEVHRDERSGPATGGVDLGATAAKRLRSLVARP